MRHNSLPRTMTPERLAEWIDLNKVDTHDHTDKVDYTEEEIREFEHNSSAASRAIDKLKDVMAHFVNFIKKGTPYDQDKGINIPINVTIPPTKGIEALTANREFADQQIERGHKLVITKLYLVPNPEEVRMIMVDIEGTEWPKYSRNMTKDEVKQFSKPLLRTVAGTEIEGLMYNGTDEKGVHQFTVEEEKLKGKKKKDEELDL